MQMGQAERDRRRIERLEIERQQMARRAREKDELMHPPDPAEALNLLEPDVTWGEKASPVQPYLELAGRFCSSASKLVN